MVAGQRSSDEFGVRVMTEMDKLIELARDPSAFWETSPPPEVLEQPASRYYLIVSPASSDDDRFTLALKLLRERFALAARSLSPKSTRARHQPPASACPTLSSLRY